MLRGINGRVIPPAIFRWHLVILRNIQSRLAVETLPVRVRVGTLGEGGLHNFPQARVVESADTAVSNAAAARRESSSLSTGTKQHDGRLECVA